MKKSTEFGSMLAASKIDSRRSSAASVGSTSETIPIDSRNSCSMRSPSRSPQCLLSPSVSQSSSSSPGKPSATCLAAASTAAFLEDSNLRSPRRNTTRFSFSLVPDKDNSGDNHEQGQSLQKCHSADEVVVSNKSSKESIILEEKEVIHGVHVKSVTRERLVQELVDAFSLSSGLPIRPTFVKVVLLMHKWFMSSAALGESMVRNCSLRNDDQNVDNYSLDRIIFDEKQIENVFRHWIGLYPMDFLTDPILLSIVNRFSEALSQKGNNRLYQYIENNLSSSHEWSRGSSGKHQYMKQESKVKDEVSLVFNKISSRKLAEQLTVLEFKAFRGITFTDLKNYCTSGSLKNSPRLEKSIGLFNALSQWVQCMVLNKTTPQQRAEVIVRFIQIAQELLKIQNFSIFFALIGGITHSSIARLGRTCSATPSESQKILVEFSELLSTQNNFAAYRKAIQQCTGFFIPVLGVHLKDLISYHNAYPNCEVNGMINFRKMTYLYTVFSLISDCQYESLPFEEDKDLCHTLRLSLDLSYTEEEIYELSLAREPRNSIPTTIPQTKSVVFADWLAGVKPPDSLSVKRHVYDMVDAVFKVYDHDKDGFISHDEFEEIAENFPFIDSFAVLDADNDGAISKEEMTNYFIRANSNALRNSFKHDFHENTYFKPTYCSHCTGLLWGLIKQGWRCRVCGLNAHKHCKDMVVMECRSRQNSLYHRNSTQMNDNEGLPLHSGSTRSSHTSPTTSPKRSKKRQDKQKWRRHTSSTYSNSAFSPDMVSKPVISSEQQPSSPVTTGTQTTSVIIEVSDNVTEDPPIYQDPVVLYDSLLKLEQINSQIKEENTRLEEEVERQRREIEFLKSHVATFRQRTLTFILGLMETLNTQKDTEV